MPVRFKSPVRVTGSGSFAIHAGDSETPLATATAADGAKELSFAIAEGETVRFVYEPGKGEDGGATFGAIAGDVEMLLIVRHERRVLPLPFSAIATLCAENMV